MLIKRARDAISKLTGRTYDNSGESSLTERAIEILKEYGLYDEGADNQEVSETNGEVAE